MLLAELDDEEELEEELAELELLLVLDDAELEELLDELEAELLELDGVLLDAEELELLGLLEAADELLEELGFDELALEEELELPLALDDAELEELLDEAALEAG